MIKDSDKKIQAVSGMVRSTAEGKIDYSLALDGPLFERLAKHLSEAANRGIYAKRNWMKAASQEEYGRFRESFIRHFVQYLRGDADEDHFAAVAFNLNGMEYVKEKLNENRSFETVLIKDGLGTFTDRRVGPTDQRKCNDKQNGAVRRIKHPSGRRLNDIHSEIDLPVCRE